MGSFMDDIKQIDEVILFIDEVHTLIGGVIDASNILKPALTRAAQVEILGVAKDSVHPCILAGYNGPSKKVKLDWESCHKIAAGAAQGLAYLHHDCSPRIIHRDVKSSNILLDENFEALSYFGIAKFLPATKAYASTYALGTIGYIDPEYAMTSRLTEICDVDSFGIVLLELLTGKKAVDNESNLHQLILSKADDNTIMEAVDPEVSVTCMDLSHVRKTFQLALLCTRRHPSERPTMHEVATILQSFLPAAKKPSSGGEKKTGYAELHSQQQRQQHEDDDNSSDAQWFFRFRELVSNNTF